MVAHKLRLDPAVYFTDSDTPTATAKDRQAIRDAAATVIYEEEQQAHERAKQQ